MALESGFPAVPGSPKLASIDPATISYLFGISPQRSTAIYCHKMHTDCNPQDSATRCNQQPQVPDMAGQSVILQGGTSDSAGTPCL